LKKYWFIVNNKQQQKQQQQKQQNHHRHIKNFHHHTQTKNEKIKLDVMGGPDWGNEWNYGHNNNGGGNGNNTNYGPRPMKCFYCRIERHSKDVCPAVAFADADEAITTVEEICQFGENLSRGEKVARLADKLVKMRTDRLSKRLAGKFDTAQSTRTKNKRGVFDDRASASADHNHRKDGHEKYERKYEEDRMTNSRGGREKYEKHDYDTREKCEKYDYDARKRSNEDRKRSNDEIDETTMPDLIPYGKRKRARAGEEEDDRYEQDTKRRRHGYDDERADYYPEFPTPPGYQSPDPDDMDYAEGGRYYDHGGIDRDVDDDEGEREETEDEYQEEEEDEYEYDDADEEEFDFDHGEEKQEERKKPRKKEAVKKPRKKGKTSTTTKNKKPPNKVSKRKPAASKKGADKTKRRTTM